MTRANSIERDSYFFIRTRLADRIEIITLFSEIIPIEQLIKNIDFKKNIKVIYKTYRRYINIINNIEIILKSILNRARPANCSI